MAAKEKPQYINFQEIISNVNLEEIVEAIRNKDEGEKPLDDWAFEDCKRLIWAAGEKWLPRDLYEFTLDGTEIEGFIAGTDNALPFHGFGDMLGTIKGRIEPFTDYAGRRFCLDWKTRKNTLDTAWRTRLIDSWQWKDYATMFEVALVLYRGLSRKGDLAEIIIRVPENNDEEVLRHIKGVEVQIAGLRAASLTVWPQNKPFACSAYGRQCGYYSDCADGVVPELVPPDKALSYSFVSTFMLCNEKARRQIIDGKSEGTEETDFGNCTHRGLASLWSQAYKIYAG